MSTPTINVVGSGMAGSLVARVLREKGYEVVVIDNNLIFSASRASSNLFINHWLKKFSNVGAANGVAVLRRLFNEGQIEKPFAQGLGYAMEVEHIPQDYLLVDPDVKESVEAVEDEGVLMFDGRLLPGPTIVCTGHTPIMRMKTPVVDLEIKVGHCYLFRGRLKEGQSRIALVSPYTHEKLYQFDTGTIYYADSVAVKEQTYWANQEKFLARSVERYEKHLGKGMLIKEFRIGYRPIIKSYPFGKLTRHDFRVWSLNGGGKNGMVCYAHHAERFADELEEVL